MKWTEKLQEVSTDTYRRLCECHSTKKDIPVLVNVKWSTMKENGLDKQGLTKEDVLVDILELLECNGQYFDLTRDEYNELKEDWVSDDRKKSTRGDSRSL